MPITEILPLLKDLSYSDKLLLLNFLVTALLKESGLTPLDAQSPESSQGLHDSFEAATILAQALAEENMEKHGRAS